MELALLCGLVVMAGVIPIQGGILNLNKMVKQVTGKTPFLSYWPYGCHCGLGGRGQPKDASDWCCRTHDCCYAHLKTHRCRFHTDHYRYNFSQGEIYCSLHGSLLPLCTVVYSSLWCSNTCLSPMPLSFSPLLP
ncbi:group IID secretory phospholipase A2 isoform X4 [Aotus nancymaae]|uniref:group IID secretory phospholipase A2 isoform X4 n=1 Tax=Aotus nancymaae TaxID=37293 RepID=UPI0030FE7ACE